MTRPLSVWLFGAPIVLALAWLAALEWRAEGVARDLSRGGNPGAGYAALMVPLMEAPWRSAARALMAHDPGSEPAEAALAKSLELRPLYAPTWFDRARLERQHGENELATAHAAHAQALWSANPRIAWNVANLYLEAGRPGPALDALRAYWQLNPGDARQVLSLANLVAPSHDALYRAVVPEQTYPTLPADYYPTRFQHHARATRNARMAVAGWNNAPERLRQAHEFALPYIDFMITQRRLDAAADAWHRLTGEPIGPGTISNAGFESPRITGGFGWRFANTPGANTIIDDATAHGGTKSLTVAFDGSENLNYHHARQTIVVEPNNRYRLEGVWQGRDITTRSGIFVDIRTLDAEDNTYARSEPRHGSWDWQSFAVEFETPRNASLAELRIRRAPTDALDSRIAGQAWFDDFVLARLAP